MHVVGRPSFALLARLLVVTIAPLAAACGSDSGTDPLGIGAVTRVSADSQTTVAGVAMAEPLVLLVAGRDGAPRAGVPVSWGILSGGGTLSRSTDTTDAAGHARTVYTPGTAAGSAQVAAQAGSLPPVAFNLTLKAGPAAALKKFGATNPAVIKGSTLTLSVKVVDQFGNGVSGVTVTWTANGGSTSASTSTSDSGGVATTSYVIGDTPGSYTLTATADGLGSVSFVVTAI